MRLGILADIHGNSDALAAALDGARRELVDALCIAGDLVGYYYHPAAVMDLLDPWKKFLVRGNHEDMLKRSATDASYLDACTERYGKGLAVALAELSNARLEYLHALPPFLALNLDGVCIHMGHGAPWDVNQYIYPDAANSVMDILGESKADLIILGHTHYRMIRSVQNTLIVNPGSVGQPRDGKQGAAWALFDTATRKVDLFAENYDSTRVRSAAKKFDPDLPYLHEIFDRQ
jgi:putative phosphoesterase